MRLPKLAYHNYELYNDFLKNHDSIVLITTEQDRLKMVVKIIHELGVKVEIVVGDIKNPSTSDNTIQCALNFSE